LIGHDIINDGLIREESETVIENLDTISKATTEVYYIEISWDEANVKEFKKKII